MRAAVGVGDNLFHRRTIKTRRQVSPRIPCTTTTGEGDEDSALHGSGIDEVTEVAYAARSIRIGRTQYAIAWALLESRSVGQLMTDQNRPWFSVANTRPAAEEMTIWSPFSGLTVKRNPSCHGHCGIRHKTGLAVLNKPEGSCNAIDLEEVGRAVEA